MHLHDAKYEVSPAITCIKVNVTLISSGFFCPTMDNIAPVLSMVQPHMACNNYSAAAYLLPEERCSCFPLKRARNYSNKVGFNWKGHPFTGYCTCINKTYIVCRK